MSDLTLNITLLSDWRIGSGTGRPGDIDHLIRRDRHQLPFLPGKTLTGILRDGCELVALALDQDLPPEAQTRWRDWVDYLFGSQPNQDQAPSQAPTPAHFSIQSAHLPQVIREAISGKPLLQTALTFVKPGIKIDAHSGSVEEKCFRLEEMARGGDIQLTATCCLDEMLTKEEQDLAKALLAAGAALSERIGGKRRRGAGQCRMAIAEFSLSDAHDYLNTMEQPLALPEEKDASPNEAIQVSSSTDWHCLPINITTQQPLIVAKATIGNVIQTQDYIPGSYLLPIVARHLARWGVDLSLAIAQNAFVITNAYPCEGDQAGSPMPFALFREKAKEKGPVYNRLKDADSRSQLKQCREGYVLHPPDAQQKNSYHTLKISTGIETHNTVKDETQRPESDVGGVYSYQAIPAQTQLQAELRISAPLWDELNQKAQLKGENRPWWQCLAGSHSLGRSRKDEYGTVTWEFPSSELQKSEPATLSDDSVLKTRLTVWCLSDILLRDEWLRPSVDPKVFAQRLSEALDIEETPLAVIPFKAGAASQFARHHRIESWQTRWGLARPSLVGIQAGSCFTFAVPEEANLTPEKLQVLEYSGIGERCVEGFGQIRLNHPLLEATQLQLPESKRQSPGNLRGGGKLIPSHDAAYDYAHIVELEAWRTAMRRIAMAIADDPAKRKELLGFSFETDSKDKSIRSKPSLTQLGGLRSQLMQLHRTGSQSPNNVQRWLQSLVDAKKWPDSAGKVMDYVRDREKIWTQLNFSHYLKVDRQAMLLTQGGEQAIKDELWAEAVETFLSACIRAHKRDAEAKQKKSAQQEVQAHG